MCFDVLRENWRMCSGLLMYPKTTIYSDVDVREGAIARNCSPLVRVMIIFYFIHLSKQMISANEEVANRTLPAQVQYK